MAKLFFEARGAIVNYGTPASATSTCRAGASGCAFLAEAVGTFILVWAVMGTAVNPDAPKGVAGAAIGGALALGVLLFGPATGASSTRRAGSVPRSCPAPGPTAGCT